MNSKTFSILFCFIISICRGYRVFRPTSLRGFRALNSFSDGSFSTNRHNQKAVALALLLISQGFNPRQGIAVDLKEEVYDYERVLLEEEKQPRVIMQKVNKNLQPNKRIKQSFSDKEIEVARDRIVTLKAYLDEIERDVFRKSWDRLQSYLYIFSEQEDAFAYLIEGLFPSDNELDRSARAALSFEAKAIYLALDDLRQAGRNQQIKPAQKAYAQLMLSYDRFLKAGDLYAAYDPITSTEVFFKNFPKETLRYLTKIKYDVWDNVLLITGPDMGKTGKIIDIYGNNVIVKFDYNGLPFQEVKVVRMDSIGIPMDDKENSSENSKS
mmetsp:Transcript_19667/g.19762  ORF Transcript_19667/g.19762 Transcript_19667/m.19762 type:complete len:325 (-) Transcript_19667:21-995(-)